MLHDGYGTKFILSCNFANFFLLNKRLFETSNFF